VTWRRLLLVAALGSACSFELAPLAHDLGPDAPLGGAAGAPAGGAAGSIASGGAAGIPSGGGIAGTAGGGAGGDASLGGRAGSGGAAGPLLGSFALGYYWVTTEAEFPGTKDTNLYDPSCKLLATVTAGFAASLKKLGTGSLDNGMILSYDGACSCPTSPCYVVADAAHPWGYGVQGKALVPFRTIAVDPAEIPYGKHLYVPAFDGLDLPGSAPWGGYVHDGCVSADDTGGALSGKQLRWFVALNAYSTSLDATLGLVAVLVYDGGTRCP
jgi:3D (Asp-Asp-Asp) domain-containing protein